MLNDKCNDYVRKPSHRFSLSGVTRGHETNPTFGRTAFILACLHRFPAHIFRLRGCACGGSAAVSFVKERKRSEKARGLSPIDYTPARLADKRVLGPDPLANHPGPEGEGGAPPSPPATSSTPSGTTSLLPGKRCPMRAKPLPFRITGPHQVRGSGSDEARSMP